MRDRLGGLIDSERLAITALSVAHAQLTVSAVAGGIKAHRVPKLADFIPDTPQPELEKPRDIETFAHALLAVLAV